MAPNTRVHVSALPLPSCSAWAILPEPQFLHLRNGHDEDPLSPEVNNVRYAKFKAHVAHSIGAKAFLPLSAGSTQAPVYLQLIVFMKYRYLPEQEKQLQQGVGIMGGDVFLSKKIIIT